MDKTLKFGALALALAVAIGGTAYFMRQPAPQQQAARSDEQLGAFIRDYLIANPEILADVQVALRDKQEAEKAQVAKAVITDNADKIFNDPADIVLGNPEGDVTVVEFFDYNCGFCKRAVPDMTKMIEDDPNVRFVLKEFPILGPDSLAAHRVAMAFRKQMPEKYRDFHLALMSNDIRATEASAIEVATGLGADEAALRADMDDPAINESIKDAYTLADALGINGTPSYVVGDEAVFGAMGADVLQEKVANLRTCQSTIC